MVKEVELFNGWRRQPSRALVAERASCKILYADAMAQAKRLAEELKVAEKAASEAGGQFRDGVRSAWGYAVEELGRIEAEREGARREIAVADALKRDAEVWLKAHSGDSGLGEALVEIGRSGSEWEHVRASLEKARNRLAGLVG